MYDDRFTSDLLADVLFIQQSKTLLRRHLSIQFSQLLGKDLNQKKREAQCKPKYRPLTISSKVKVSKILLYNENYIIFFTINIVYMTINNCTM